MNNTSSRSVFSPERSWRVWPSSREFSRFSNPSPAGVNDQDLREATLCFLVRGAPPVQVLLGYKKIGFGQGKYTGFGGKVDPGETIRQAASREMLEETGVQVASGELRYVARLSFVFPFTLDWSQVVHAFIASSWVGEPREGEEMRPAWYVVSDLPFQEMWQDGVLWLPLILSGRRINAHFTFGRDNETIQQVEILDLEEKNG